MQKVTLLPNIPQLIALQDPEDDYKTAAEQVEYLTTDGRLLVLNVSDATRLNEYDLKPGETLWLCKRITGQRGELPHIDMWLSPATEKARADVELE